MEQPLHNKIFGPTSCLSREQLLKYGKNALTQKEKHKVEKHLIECELCSDAIEGMVMTSEEETKAVCASIRQISQISPGQRIFSLYSWKKTLLLAASIIGIAFFPFYFLFNKKNLQQKELITDKIELPKPNSAKITGGEMSEEAIPEEQWFSTSEKKEPLKNVTQSENNNYKSAGKDGLGESANVIVEKEISGRSISTVDMATAQAQTESTTKSQGLTGGYTGVPAAELNTAPADILQNDILSKETAPDQTSALAELTITREEEAEELESEKKELSEARASGMKIKDEEKASKRGKKTENFSGVSAQSPAKEKAAARVFSGEEAQTTGFIYDLSLRDALAYMEKKEYKAALEKFQTIIQYYPDDYVSVFNSGLAWYNLGNMDKALINFQTVLSSGNESFAEKSNWYIALIHEKKNELEMAKALFKKIAETESSFKQAASEKLKELEK